MPKKKSLYELICENIKDGKLDKSFSLPDEESKYSVRFADGCMDGMCVYHICRYDMTKEDTELLEQSVKALEKGDVSLTDSLWAQLGKTARAIQIVDDFQSFILEHRDEIDVNTAFDCVYEILYNSTNRESIKFALEFLELLSIDGVQFRDVIRTLGLSDEFTIFSAWIMRRWENGNNELLELAKKVYGWGRIHIVDMIEPETDEIREWLLTEGTQNYIMNAYSALVCWEKSDAYNRLNEKLTLKEFGGILTIAESLLDEGPVPGISQIDNANEILTRIIELSSEFSLTLDEYESIRAISIWTDHSDYMDIKEKCSEVLHSDKCINTVKKALDNGDGIELAIMLGIDYKEQLMLSLEKDIEKNKFLCDRLLYDERYTERVLKVFRAHIPFEKMTGEPESDSSYGENFKTAMTYTTLVGNLRNKPHFEEELVLKGLRCKKVDCRNAALHCIMKWVSIENKPLNIFSMELFDAVSELYKKEPNEDAKIKEKELLQGKTDFDI